MLCYGERCAEPKAKLRGKSDLPARVFLAGAGSQIDHKGPLPLNYQPAAADEASLPLPGTRLC